PAPDIEAEERRCACRISARRIAFRAAHPEAPARRIDLHAEDRAQAIAAGRDEVAHLAASASVYRDGDDLAFREPADEEGPLDRIPRDAFRDHVLLVQGESDAGMSDRLAVRDDSR